MNLKINFLCFLLSIISSTYSKAQSVSSISTFQDTVTISYLKAKSFSFITNIPKDAVGVLHGVCKKNAIKPALIMVGSTALFLLTDEVIAHSVKQFAKHNNISAAESNINLWTANIAGKQTTLLKLPGNINTAFYQLGQGFPTMLLSTGLFTFGKIKKDAKALSTANQLAEGFILMGIGTQLFKRIAGRQTPGSSIDGDSKWRLFPSTKDFQTNTPNYDAFPSGHLATLMNTVTTLALNYPNKRYIKPVGYTIIGLVGLSMINNDVHWASDFPFAIGFGYLCAKQVFNRSIKLKHTNINKNNMTYSINYFNQQLISSFIYHF